MVNIEQGFTDPTDIIKTSLQLGKPVIIVHFAYRLNVFGYGMFQGRTNFGFHDQRRAIEWVQKHISGFGGDPENITLAGESAGGIAVHAHIHGPCPVRGIKRAVLQSGSLYLTPPAPAPVGHVIMKELELICQTTDLQTLPLRDLLTGMGKLGFKNWWLNQEDRIFSQGAEDAVWPITDTVGLESIVVGDCQWESRGFEAGIAALGLNRLEEIFSQYTPIGAAVAQLYNIDFQSMESTKPRIGAFINDLKFAFASDALSLMENKAGRRRCYRYIVDQPNPWNPSAGAHHAVDLLLLFGGYDYTNDEGAVQVSQDMRKRWIHFMYGDEPWGGNDVYAFGPAGKSGAIGKEELARRRRVQCFDGLRKIGWANCQALATRLMSARGKVEEAYL
ncbi:uncharacterized protein APUU_80993S [Aspergillus puulaauensis]|uniref:Carboxylic ester hydrolase n=1 Tax=Aspergillus puulaauensis TaxID=1220207 RepID=A0A7R7XZQ0_9EURO|nr:uncharacterized protein APUU_80993S [Aspergillus puulaauensis]BCS30690.1 hypothetical protein APUU_80993S [Aspergillus puulaauensis]